jgi:alkylhydroperoxidase family enzyme
MSHAPKTRIAPLTTADFRSVERELRLSPVERPLNVMTTLAHNPSLYAAWQHLAGELFSRSLDPRDRELVILRAAWRCSSRYEWAQHARIAHDVGLTDAEIHRIASGPDAVDWPAPDALLLRAVDELVDERCISDAVWTALASRFEPAKLLSLTMLAGHYIMLAAVLNSAGVEPESADMPRLGEA